MKGMRLMTAVLLALALGNQAWAYKLENSKWPEPRTTFYPGLAYKGDPNSPSGISWNQAFRQAAEEWNEKTAFQFTIDTSNPSHPCAGVMPEYPEDGFRNGAAFTYKLCDTDALGYGVWVDYGDGTLAVTFTYTDDSDPSVTSETDILFNQNETWDVYEGFTRRTVDFRRVALHELGHALGLGHETRKEAIMQPTIDDISHLQADDIAGATALYGPPGNSGGGSGSGGDDAEPILLHVEEPAAGEAKSGISTVRGWVVSKRPLESLALYLDGVYKGNLDHSGPRKDVQRAHPDYPDSDRSGFAFAQAFGGMEAGNHRYRFVATDVDGNQAVEEVGFKVVRFETGYLKDENAVSLDDAVLHGQGNEIIINGLEHDGTSYRVRLKWSRGAQNFMPVEITRQ